MHGLILQITTHILHINVILSHCIELANTLAYLRNMEIEAILWVTLSAVYS